MNEYDAVRAAQDVAGAFDGSFEMKLAQYKDVVASIAPYLGVPSGELDDRVFIDVLSAVSEASRIARELTGHSILCEDVTLSRFAEESSTWANLEQRLIWDAVSRGISFASISGATVDKEYGPINNN